jgi:hypothetical protein
LLEDIEAKSSKAALEGPLIRINILRTQHGLMRSPSYSNHQKTHSQQPFTEVTPLKRERKDIPQLVVGSVYQTP